MTSGVNFANIVQAAFMYADPESTKKTVKFSVFFAHSGSARVKAARRMLMKKLTHGVNFTNMFMHSFFACRFQK